MAERKIEIGKAIGYGWESVKKNLWYFVGMAIVVAVVQGIPSYFDKSDMGIESIISLVLSTWITVGYLHIILNFYKNKKKPLSEMFTQWKYFGRALLASIWIGLIVLVGLILLVFPGIYLALKYQFVMNLIVDKNIGVSEAMKESAEMTKGVKWQLFGFGFTALGVMILGAICLGVGVLVAMPVVLIAEIYIYNNLLTKEA